MKIFDISMIIHPEMIVYPGNPPPRIEQYKSTKEEGVRRGFFESDTHPREGMREDE